jgi:hypothetical protein
MYNEINPTEESVIFKQLAAERERVAKFSVQATQQLATAVGDIYRQNPQLPAGVVLASAQAGLTQDQINGLSSETALKRNQDPDAVAGKKSKSFFQRNFVDKLKTASRYTFATLETSTQLLQNAGSQVFGNNPDGIDGWFASTDLGSLIKNDEVAGNGYFIGGEAKSLQAKRVQNFRGTTTGGHAWSFGRGTAGIIFDEGSTAYNLMSGIVDGAVALSVPIAPGFKQAAGAVKVAAEAQGASDIVRGADRTFDLLRGQGTKILPSNITAEEYDALVKSAGLTGRTVDPVEANKFLGTDKWFRLRDRLVEADTLDAVRKLTNDNVYPETLVRLRDAKDADAVTREMIDILGIAQQGVTRTVMPGTKRFGVSNARRVAVIDNLLGTFENSRAGRISERAFESRPSRTIVDFSSDNPVDVRRTINDIDRWMKASLTKQEDRVKFLDQAADSLIGVNATPTARKKLYDDFHKLIKQSWIDDGLDQNVATAVLDGQVSRQVKSRGYSASLGSELDDGKFYEGFANKNGGIVNGVFGGPALQSELANLTLEMPDIAQVRRLTGKINKVWAKSARAEFTSANYIDENIDRLSKAGQLRLPFATANYMQEQIFRKVILATSGFGIRNLMEGQISLALSQKPVTSIIRHPFQHMQWSANQRLGSKIGRKGLGDITGEIFTEEGAIKAMESYRAAGSGAIMAHYQDPTYVYRRGRRIGQFNDVQRGVDEAQLIIEAHADQIGRLNADPVGRLFAAGKTDDEVIDFIRNTDDGKKWFRDKQDLHFNSGRPVFDKTNKKWTGTQKIDLNDEHNLRLHLGEIRQRLDVNIGSHEDLRKTIESGLLPPTKIDAAAIGIDSSMRGQVWDIQMPGRNVVATARIDEADENFVRFFAFKNGEATKPLEDLLSRPNILQDQSLAQTLSHETRVAEKLGKRGFKEEYDSMFDRFFAFIHGKPSAYLEKHPAFKQRYYTWAVDEMITSLSPAELDKMIQRIEDAAKIAKVSPSDWVGDKTEFAEVVGRLFKTSKPAVGDRWERILELQKNPKKLKGTLTLSEVDEFAKGQALDDLAKMTYDATERNNLTDVSRFILPFGQAQLEFFRRLGRIYTVETGLLPLPNLNAMRKTQLLVEGGREADPDGDGRGIFYTDPGTGEWVVDYPFTGPFTHLLTSMVSGGPGVRSTLQAPIKGALMGLDVRPGLGPVAQIAVSAFAPDIPQLDAFKAAVLPYGEVDLAGNKGLIGSAADAFTPAWFKKIQSAFIDSPESMTTYGNTYFEVYQALSTTGEYDLKTPAGMDRLYQDAKSQAKALTILRGIGQFLGPSRPTNKFQVETLQGDVMVNVLSQELRTMQLEDYDSAIPRFLDIYGEDVFVYLSGKTKAVYGGLLASKQFGDFERANGGLFRKYKNVASFFATGGTDLDWQVYTRQIETGMRERLTPEESLQAAQKYVAYSKYRQVQTLVGPYPNAEQKAYLRQYREYLGEQYPGFALATFDPNRIKNNIAELTLAVQESSLADNNVAKAAKLYLDARENVMAEATNRGLSSIDRSKNAADLRGYLRQYAELLKKDYPEFSRLYDRILIDEVDE